MLQKRHLLFLSLCFAFLFCLFTPRVSISAWAQTDDAVSADESPTVVSQFITPEYVSGQVTEVLSEVEVDDQVMDHHNKTVRFKVAFPAYGEQPAHTLELEQSFDPEDYPVKI